MARGERGRGRSEAAAGSCKPVWVLLGNRSGDNNQLLAVAEALGLPYDVIQLRFIDTSRSNVLLGASTRGIRNPQDLPAGSPRLVLSVGRRSPPVARWIRKRSGGTARLVHFGRPWGPTKWFDLVVTTPQYGLPARPNVLCNRMPFLSTARPHDEAALSEQVARLPRPWTVLLVGGRSRPYVFNEHVAAALADHADRRAQQLGGSLLLIPSPRTPAPCVELMSARLTVPSYTYRRDAEVNPYRTLLTAGDRFIVTCDSATMVSEALVFSGKPVELYRLPTRFSRKLTRVSAWERLAVHSGLARWLLQWAQWLGFVTFTRNLGAFYRELELQGVFSGTQDAAALARKEQQATLERIAALLR